MRKARRQVNRAVLNECQGRQLLCRFLDAGSLSLWRVSLLPASKNLHNRRHHPPSGFSKEKDPPLDQKGKEEDQGLIVLATRKPRVSNRTLVWRLTRTAARTERADSLRQEPPRTTRKLGSPPRNHADPSIGAPS